MRCGGVFVVFDWTEIVFTPEKGVDAVFEVEVEVDGGLGYCWEEVVNWGWL